MSSFTINPRDTRIAYALLPLVEKIRRRGRLEYGTTDTYRWAYPEKESRVEYYEVVIRNGIFVRLSIRTHIDHGQVDITYTPTVGSEYRANISLSYETRSEEDGVYLNAEYDSYVDKGYVHVQQSANWGLATFDVFLASIYGTNPTIDPETLNEDTFEFLDYIVSFLKDREILLTNPASFEPPYSIEFRDFMNDPIIDIGYYQKTSILHYKPMEFVPIDGAHPYTPQYMFLDWAFEEGRYSLEYSQIGRQLNVSINIGTSTFKVFIDLRTRTVTYESSGLTLTSDKFDDIFYGERNIIDSLVYPDSDILRKWASILMSDREGEVLAKSNSFMLE